MNPILPRLIDHRGAAAHAPENTLAGLAKAKSLGVAWVEFDVMLTRDGVPVLLHDENLQRTCGVDRLLAATSCSELESIDAGRWFGSAYAGERIPTLEAAIACLGQLGMGANVEIKPSAGQEHETALATIETVRRCWPANLPPPILSSFELTSLETAQAAAPELARGYLLGELTPGWEATARRLGAVSIHTSHEPLQRAHVEAVKADGYQLAIYTVNDPACARELFAWGVDALFTDDPQALAATP
jgi:glycerophosphoryl diester phosphodiesterase